MGKTVMDSAGNDAPNVAKSGYLSKVVKVTVVVALGAGILYLMDKQKEKFIDGVMASSVASCGNNEACLSNLKSHFAECLESNYESHKSGKFSRDYVLDQAAYDRCLTASLPPAAADAPLSDADTALFAAVEQETPSLEAVKAALDAGARLDVVNGDGDKPLLVALSRVHADVALLLLERGAPLDVPSVEPILCAAMPTDSDALFDALVARGAKVNEVHEMGSTPLLCAIQKQTPKFVDKLIAAGADVNLRGVYGTFPLEEAIRFGQPSVVKRLLEAGAALKPEDGCLVTAAGTPGVDEAIRADLIHLLLARGAGVNERFPNDEWAYAKGSTPLIAAVYAQDLPAVKTLLGAGADLEAEDVNGNTALFYASGQTWPSDGEVWSFGEKITPLIEFLLKSGANLEHKNHSGETPLAMAQAQGRAEVIALLTGKKKSKR